MDRPRNTEYLRDIIYIHTRHICTKYSYTKNIGALNICKFLILLAVNDKDSGSRSLLPQTQPNRELQLFQAYLSLCLLLWDKYMFLGQSTSPSVNPLLKTTTLDLKTTQSLGKLMWHRGKMKEHCTPQKSGLVVFPS